MDILTRYRHDGTRPTLKDKLATVDTQLELAKFIRGLERQGIYDGNAKIAAEKRRQELGERK